MRWCRLGESLLHSLHRNEVGTSHPPDPTGDLSMTHRKGGRGHIRELVDQQVVPSSGRS
jgi:hypothetical protein